MDFLNKHNILINKDYVLFFPRNLYNLAICLNVYDKSFDICVIKGDNFIRIKQVTTLPNLDINELSFIFDKYDYEKCKMRSDKSTVFSFLMSQCFYWHFSIDDRKRFENAFIYDDLYNSEFVYIGRFYGRPYIPMIYFDFQSKKFIITNLTRGHYPSNDPYIILDFSNESEIKLLKISPELCKYVIMEDFVFDSEILTNIKNENTSSDKIKYQNLGQMNLDFEEGFFSSFFYDYCIENITEEEFINLFSSLRSVDLFTKYENINTNVNISYESECGSIYIDFKFEYKYLNSFDDFDKLSENFRKNIYNYDFGYQRDNGIEKNSFGFIFLIDINNIEEFELINIIKNMIKELDTEKFKSILEPLLELSNKKSILNIRDIFC